MKHDGPKNSNAGNLGVPGSLDYKPGAGAATKVDKSVMGKELPKSPHRARPGTKPMY